MDRFLRMVEVKRTVGLSESTIYRRISEGEFPKPVPLGANSVGWLESEINDWKAQMIAQRDMKRCA